MISHSKLHGYSFFALTIAFGGTVSCSSSSPGEDAGSNGPDSGADGSDLDSALVLDHNSIDPDAPDVESILPTDGRPTEAGALDVPSDRLIPPDDTIRHSEGGGGWDAGMCAPEPDPRCAAPVHLTSVADLATAINGLPWQFVLLGNGHLLTSSGDLIADVDLEIDGSALDSSGSGCAWIDGGCTVPRFRDGLFPRLNDPGRVPGLKCIGSNFPPPSQPTTCRAMSVAQGTTFRVRKVSERGVFGTRIDVEFDRACTVSCDADETRCEASQTCVQRGYNACLWCDGGPSDVCSCRDRCGGPMADGIACSYDLADDYGGVGTCSAGRCCSTCGDQ